jgi:hypothetical protein
MPIGHLIRIATAASLLGAIAFSVGCGDDDGGPSASLLVIEQTLEETGDDQVGNVEQPLDDPLRVIVTRDGQPVEDEEVQWLTTAGGSFTPGTSLTGPDGIATTSWTLGPDAGDQTANARLVGAEGSPVTFSALALNPPPPGGGGGGPELLRRPLVP